MQRPAKSFPTRWRGIFIVGSAAVGVTVLATFGLTAIGWAQPPAGAPGSAAPAAVAPAQAAAATAPGASPLSALTGDQLGKTVTVVGKLTNKAAPTGTTGRGPYRWYLSDGAGVALVVIFPDLHGQLPNPDEAFPNGALLQVRGQIKEYRGQLQVVPNAASDIQKVPEGSPMGVWGLGAAGSSSSDAPGAAPAAAPGGVPGAAPGAVAAAPAALPAEPPAGYLFPGKVTRDLIQKPAKVLGRVSQFRSSWSATAPNILTLEGGGGTLDCVYWKDIDQSLADRRAQVTTVGAIVEVEGTLSEYRNRLQLRMSGADQMKVWGAVGAAAPAAPAVPAVTAPAPAAAMPAAPASASTVPSAPAGGVVTPSQITKADLGKTLLISGTVKRIQPSTAERTPTRVELGDDQGSISVVYWKDLENVFAGDAAPQVGKTWKIEGTVGEFRNALQIRAKGPAK